MSKIASISCIILAVSINFEGTQASLLRNPIGSLLNVHKQVLDTLQGVTGTESLQNVGKDASELGAQIGADITTGSELNEGLIKQASIMSCIKLPNEARTTINELKSIYNSCVSSETQTINDNIQTLGKLAKDLEKTIADTIKEIISQNTGNPITDIPNLIKDLEDLLEKLSPEIDDVLSTVLKLLTSVSNIAVCFENSYNQNVQQDVHNLVNDAKACYQSVANSF